MSISSRSNTASVSGPADYVAVHGITRIERVMTDNAWAYQHSLRDVIAELDAKQARSGAS